ncbi:ABC transporter ATP-binding protein [Petroclostridium sp. X23]|uniref:ABC transporter ATP-binding protein n=1 Tax=Petroclostridium sp. X23 TaxID=3045146 RepID=UPI0024AE53E6|nr:ABC transporter ATP-binding protein [Petroclostridium sp. X23]WHH60919.1 ABC transporter ATP-binding protein [Petroclostridium sp. X23]
MVKVILDIKNLSVSYGPLNVVHDVNLSVQEGEIMAFIGSNGAGKSSIINAICGVVPGRSGAVTFNGERIDALKPNERVERGLVQIPEGRLIFSSLTVLENLQMGATLPGARAKLKESLEFVCEIFPRLAERKKQFAGTLSGGEQQMVAIGRGLMSCPKLLILDEPSWGLAPKITSEVFEAVRKINREGVTIILVEQHIQQCLRVAERACVIENGIMTKEGLSADLLNDDHVRCAYLGL